MTRKLLHVLKHRKVIQKTIDFAYTAMAPTRLRSVMLYWNANEDSYISITDLAWVYLSFLIVALIEVTIALYVYLS